MDLNVPPEVNEFINCSCCFMPFDDGEYAPKLLNCRHYFCLKCVNSLLYENCVEICCLHCWKPTKLPEAGKAESLITHNAIVSLTKHLQVISLNASEATSSRSGQNDIVDRGRGGALYERRRSTSVTSLFDVSNDNTISSYDCTTLSTELAPTATVNSSISGSSSNNTLSSNLNSILCSGNNIFNFNITTERPASREICIFHAMPNSLWCVHCNLVLCRACAVNAGHREHTIRNQMEVRNALQHDIHNEIMSMQRTLNEVQHMLLHQRDFMHKVLEHCTMLKTQIETELMNNVNTMEMAGMREGLNKARACVDMLPGETPVEAQRLYMMISSEKKILVGKYRDLFVQSKLNEMMKQCNFLIDFSMIKDVLGLLRDPNGTIPNFDAIGNGDVAGAIVDRTSASVNPMILVANYCISQLRLRDLAMVEQQQRMQLERFGNTPQQLENLQHSHQQQQQQQTYNLTRESLNSLISQVNASVNIGNNDQQHHLLEQQRHLSFADIVNPTPSTSAAAAAAAAAATNNPNLHQHQLHQMQQMMLTQPSNNSSSTSSSTSSYGERTPIGTPSSSGGIINNHQMITTRNVAAQLFSTTDFAGLDLSLLYFQQHTSSSSTSTSTNSTSTHDINPPNQSHHQSPLQQQSQHQHLNQKHPTPPPPPPPPPPPLLNQHLLHHQHLEPPSQSQFRKAPSMRVYPLYFFNIEMNGRPMGRFIIEVYRDKAPRMAKNFHALVKHDFGYGYKGCQIFQCWEKESIITGDFELNNGRGGRSVFEKGYFMPDATKIVAIRGCVGMRRTQKRHDNCGSVGSQFRIILREMRGFTGIFGRIVEGIELVAKIAQTGDSTGKPSCNIVIINCGEYRLN